MIASPHARRHLARLVLAWFALCLVVAACARWIDPQPGEAVCSATGGVLLEQGDSGHGKGLLHQGLDCPLCLSAVAPPPDAMSATVPPSDAVAQAASGVYVAPLVIASSASLPARGPPLFV